MTVATATAAKINEKIRKSSPTTKRKAAAIVVRSVVLKCGTLDAFVHSLRVHVFIATCFFHATLNCSHSSLFFFFVLCWV